MARATLRGTLGAAALLLWCATSTAAVPLPTPAQLAYQQGEITALTHFNMATFVQVRHSPPRMCVSSRYSNRSRAACLLLPSLSPSCSRPRHGYALITPLPLFQNGDPACNPSNWNAGINCSNPATFNPTKLDTDQWVSIYKALGATSAVLTAKHGCGFLLWPSKVKLPNGETYPYAVGSPNAAYKGDVVGQFSKSCQDAGIGHGFYYSLPRNFYLNVNNFQVGANPLPGQGVVTQQQFEDIAFAQVTELWTNYGQLFEIWMDGGYGQLGNKIKALLGKQPNTVAFNGDGVSPNPVRWVGTESGTPQGPLWSTGCSNQGDPTSTEWCPAGCDTTLQEGDTWFYVPGTAIRTLAELIEVYHKTVGQNGVLELDFAIDREGRVNDTHAARYTEFGTWIRNCYGTPVANTTGSGSQLSFHMPTGAGAVDRVMLREDISQGQRIREFSVEYQGSAGGAWTAFASGTSVGNKFISVAPAPVTATAFRLNVTSSIAEPVVSTFAVFSPCPSS